MANSFDHGTQAWQGSGRDARIVLAVLFWITFVLLADVSGTPVEQYRLGLLTWSLLLLFLQGETSVVRVQVLVAVSVATLMELIGSGLLQAYTYRLENIPSFVPPGHGLIYLAAVAGARTDLVRHNVARVQWAAVLACGTWTAWGVLAAPRADYLGGTLFLVFAGCLFVWRSPAVYAFAFAITTVLELLGTALGNWTWAEQAGWLNAGNPPSAVAAGYCVIDAIALGLGGALAAWWPRLVASTSYSYSVFNALFGSTRAARNAGSAPATSATTSSTIPTPP